MTTNTVLRPIAGRAALHRRYAGAFSLVELLTVIFIISLLIGILIPSLSAARSAAKKSKTNSDLKALTTALELFHNDNEREFPHTNGYPPSWSHPPFPGWSDFRPHEGQFPFLQETPVVYGAHWLPAMLLGLDNLGFVQRSSVPHALRDEPWMWYSPEPEGSGSRPLSRAQFYIEPEGVRTIPTRNLRGRRPTEGDFFPDWDDMRDLPVMVDAFEQPILYYVANRHGRTSNMVEDVHDENNIYTGDDQEEGPPFYFHQDNVGFTGYATEGGGDEPGWDFGRGTHALANPGDAVTADHMMDEENRETFARFILDRMILRTIGRMIEDDDASDPPSTMPLNPTNPDSYILISAGADGRYGTGDDIANFPLTAE